MILLINRSILVEVGLNKGHSNGNTFCVISVFLAEELREFKFFIGYSIFEESIGSNSVTDQTDRVTENELSAQSPNSPTEVAGVAEVRINTGCD